MPNTVLLPGIAEQLRALSDGDRVALTVATPGPASSRLLYDSRLDRSDWLALADPPALLSFRPELLERVGPLDLAAEDLGGPWAPGVDLAGRARRGQEVIGRATVTCVRRPHIRRRPWCGPQW